MSSHRAPGTQVPPPPTPAAWAADPFRRHEHRYWDGAAWTDHVANRGVASKDPITESGQVPTVIRSQPAQMLPLAAVQPKKKRRWPWVVGTLIVIAMVANAGDEDGSPAATTIRSSNQTAPAATNDVIENCRSYVTLFLPILDSAAEASANGSTAAFAAAEGDITYDDAAAVFSESADTFRRSSERVEDLGPPPAGFVEAIGLLTRALDRLETGYDLAALGAQRLDVDLVTAGSDAIEEGNVLLERGNDALETC